VRQVTSSEATWRRPLWLGLLIGVSGALTTVFACITPFVAVGVIAAMTLSRRAALCLTVAAWLANQAVGYGVLHYPWTTNSVAWGLALGGAAVVATLTAQWVVARLSAARSPIQALAAFVSAFAVYELGLYALGVSVLGGTRGFAPSIVGQVLVVNAVTLLGLYGLNQLAAVVGLVGRRAARVSPARRFA
jgi:hypothetical protein